MYFETKGDFRFAIEITFIKHLDIYFKRRGSVSPLKMFTRDIATCGKVDYRSQLSLDILLFVLCIMSLKYH